MSSLVQLLIIGISVGSIYGLIALGLILIYKSSRVVNFAQGELVVVGAFLGFTFLGRLGVPFWAAFPLSLAGTGVLGYGIERQVLRRVDTGPLITVIMVTLGVSILLKGTATLAWGTSNYAFPRVFPDIAVELAGIKIPHIYLWSLLVSVVLLGLFVLFFRFSDLGLAMRATADNQKAAVSLGVNTGAVVALSWGISAAVASVGGILLANMNVLNVNLSAVGLAAFPVLILGGLDSLPGAIVGGLIVGVLQSLAGGYLGSLAGGAVEEVVSFLLLLLILLIKPHGLFGTREIERL